MSRLDRRDVGRVRAIVDELDTVRVGRPSAVVTILPAVAELLGTAGAGMYSPIHRADGWGLERYEMHNQAPRLRPPMVSYLADSPSSFALYDAARPERAQRNRVIDANTLVTEEQIERNPMYARVFVPAGICDMRQLRTLLCDGPSLLAWFGVFHPERFTLRQVRALAALVPALRRRLQLERRLQAADRMLAALDASLALIGVPAFVVGARGTIHETNAAGRALLVRRRADVLASVQDALARRAMRIEIELCPLQTTGVGVYWLALVRRTPGDAELGACVAAAARRWRLTPRESDVLAAVARGATNKRIAADLACAEHTIEVHVSHVLAKAEVGSRAELVASLLGISFDR